MNINKLLLIIYAVLTLFAVLICDITNLSITKVIYSIIFVWILYISFFLGWNITKKKNQSVRYHKEYKNLYEKKIWHNYFLATISIIFSIFVTEYYTGQTPQMVVGNLRSGISVYYEYQIYFAQNNLDVFSIQKLPYIFMMFYCKFLMIYSYISLITFKNKISFSKYFYIFIVTISYLYIGIARGTNFEIFEWVILLMFTLLISYNQSLYKLLYRVFLISIISIIGIYIFTSNISARGVNFNVNISSDVIYDQEGVLSYYFPEISITLVKLYDYFGFGFHYITTFIFEIWFDSYGSVIKGLLPYGFHYLNNFNLSYAMSNLLDMGPRWQPDSIIIIEKIGFIGLIGFSFGMGILSKKLYTRNNISQYMYILLYIILLQMVSLPVGNFVTVSSAMKILVVYVIAKVFHERYLSKKEKNHHIK